MVTTYDAWFSPYYIPFRPIFVGDSEFSLSSQEGFDRRLESQFPPGDVVDDKVRGFLRKGVRVIHSVPVGVSSQRTGVFCFPDSRGPNDAKGNRSFLKKVC